MSTGKKVLTAFLVVSDGDMSGATVTSATTNIQYLDNIAYQLYWTGTPTGTFDVQVSGDNTNWASLPLNPVPAATASSGSAFIDIYQTAANYIRVVYTRTSGSGTLNVLISAKGL